MVDDKMLAGANRDAKLMVRVDPEEEEPLLQREGVSLMEQSGRSMHGFLYIEPGAFESDEELSFWLGKCLEYNPKAKKEQQLKETEAYKENMILLKAEQLKQQKKNIKKSVGLPPVSDNEEKVIEVRPKKKKAKKIV